LVREPAVAAVRKNKTEERAMEMTDQIEATAREIGDRVRPQIEDAKRRLTSLNDKAIDYIKENPGTCLVGAVALGFLIGKIARRV
jgi:ElaB/YqjD/DUF883 family membrane-anchored ribosome-binding protein